MGLTAISSLMVGRRETVNSLVSLAAVFSIVTQRGEERCVTILKTAARETMNSLESEMQDLELNSPYDR